MADGSSVRLFSSKDLQIDSNQESPAREVEHAFDLLQPSPAEQPTETSSPSRGRIAPMTAL